MATSEFWQRVSISKSSSQERVEVPAADSTRSLRGMTALWMIMDGITILVSAMLVTLYERHTGPVAGVKGFWQGTLIYGRSMGILLALLCGFAVTLMITSRRLHLYTPARLNNFLHEQRLSVQACFTSGLLLTGTLYLVHAEDIPRSIVLITIGLVTIGLSLRRAGYRVLLYRRFDRRTNPLVDEVLQGYPHLFEGWGEADFDELHSRVGSGGPLTFEGALGAVHAMNRKRELHDKLDVLLETGQAKTIGGILDLIYEQVVVSTGGGPDRNVPKC